MKGGGGEKKGKEREGEEREEGVEGDRVEGWRRKEGEERRKGGREGGREGGGREGGGERGRKGGREEKRKAGQRRIIETFKNLGYLVTDKETKSIIAIDPGDAEIASQHIEMLRKKLHYRFTHILTTHFHQDIHSASSRLKSSYPSIDVLIGDYGTPQAFNTRKLMELRPFSIGSLAICLLSTPGHTMDSCCWGVTDMGEGGTKIPVLFTGDTLHIG